MSDSSSFQLWIEAEEWAPGEWDPADDVTDAIVTLADGTRWVASFCTFDHIAQLRANCAESGECLGGKYLWASDLILVDDTSRASLEAVVRDLLDADELRSAFSPADEDAGAGEREYPGDAPPFGVDSSNGTSPDSSVVDGNEPASPSRQVPEAPDNDPSSPR